MRAFDVFLESLSEWWRDWLNMALLNVVWMLCWLTVLLGPPATMVAYRIASDFGRGGTLYPRELPGMLRRYFLQGWLWFLLQLVVATGVLVNLQFYARLGEPIGPLLRGATLAVTALWLLLQIYTLPYLMEQGRGGLGLALRNSLLTTLASPLYTLVLGIIVGVLAAACLRLPFLLLFGVPMLIALIGSIAVRDRLAHFGKLQPAEAGEDDEKPR